MEISLALAFAAGIVSFLTPCVLALVPVYVAFLAEAAVSAPTPDPGGAAVARSPAIKSGPVFFQALLFTLGFTTVFVLLGVSVGLIGATLFRDQLIRQLTGLVIMALG
ncbi:MAG: cytochrome c biogenesis CcdA family protein, partial [Candidatus Limnocylindria bacterium]